MKKGIWSLIGFLLIIIGITALVLSVVGVQLSFLTWIDKPGKLAGFLARLFMIMSGFIIIVLTRTDWRQENED